MLDKMFILFAGGITNDAVLFAGGIFFYPIKFVINYII